MFKREKKNILKIDVVRKTRDGFVNKVMIAGNRKELFCATADFVTSLIMTNILSNEDVVLAFKTGIEKAKGLIEKYERED